MHFVGEEQNLSRLGGLWLQLHRHIPQGLLPAVAENQLVKRLIKPLILAGNHDNLKIQVHLDNVVVDPEDIEMLQDMIIAAVNEAIRKVEDTTNEQMEKISGALNIPGLV